MHELPNCPEPQRVKKGESPQEAVPQLPPPCSQHWPSTEKHPPAIQSNTFLPTPVAPLCVTWQLTISGHQDTVHASLQSCIPQEECSCPHLVAMEPPLHQLHREVRTPKGAKQPWRNSHLQVNLSSLGRARGCPSPGAHRAAIQLTPYEHHTTTRGPAVPQTSHLSLLPRASSFTLTETQHRQPLIRVTSTTYWLHLQCLSSD